MKTRLYVTALSCLAILPVAAQAQDVNYTYFDGAFMNNGIDASISESFVDTIVLDSEFTADLSADLNMGVKDGDGYALGASWGFHPNWHAFAGYADHELDLFMNASGTLSEVDLPPTDFALAATSSGDVKDWRAGFGYNTYITENVSGFVQVSWDSRSIDFDSMSVSLTDPSGMLGPSDIIGDVDTNIKIDNEGLGANVGLRGKVTDWLELNGHVRYSEVGGIDLMAEEDDDAITSNTLYGVGAVVEFTDTFAVSGEVEAGEDVTAWAVFARLYFGG